MKKIVFLHHSTGWNIWIGSTNKYIYKLTRKGDVEKFMEKYNRKNQTNYSITEQIFPKENPYLKLLSPNHGPAQLRDN